MGAWVDVDASAAVRTLPRRRLAHAAHDALEWRGVQNPDTPAVLGDESEGANGGEASSDMKLRSRCLSCLGRAEGERAGEEQLRRADLPADPLLRRRDVHLLPRLTA